MTRLIFLDTETTGLALDDEIWEFAAIVREQDGAETSHHMFIQHDALKCARLPEPFLSDHMARFAPGELAVPQEEAAKQIEKILSGKPHIVGCVPNFDTERIALLLRRYGYEPGWHYHLVDVENLAVGWLHGVTRQACGQLAAKDKPYAALAQLPTSLPWDSEALSRAVGVEPGGYERHTALGDARWARDIYDAVTSVPDALPTPVEPK